MRRAISKNNQLPSAMPKGQRTKGLRSMGIDQLPCLGDEPATVDAAAQRVETVRRLLLECRAFRYSGVPSKTIFPWPTCISMVLMKSGARKRPQA
jgi:hypothetical protein